jgi:transcriptional antiterminator RfaH
MINRKSCAAARSSWIVVATHANREEFAIKNLKLQKYIVYCPVILKHIRHARRAYDAHRPLFPGYIFVQAVWQSWRPISGTLGVRSIVRNGGAPAFLPCEFIESLKARESGGVICKPQAPFKHGQAVAINGGQLDGLVGYIVEIRERDRILLLLNLLNQQTKVHVDVGMLRPV